KHAGPVVDARFSKDGSRVVTASSDGTAKVWSIGAGTAVADLKHLGAVNSAQFAGSGAQGITTSNDWSPRIWRIEGATPRGLVLPHDAPVDSAQVDASGRRLLTVASRARSARVWDLATGQPMGRTIVLPAAVWFAQFSPDAQRVVAAGADGVARVVPVFS